MLVRIPDVLEVCWRRCLMHLGGSGRQSEISDLGGRYKERQINFDHKSIRNVWYAMVNWIISRLVSWSDIVGWAKIPWFEEEDYLPKYVTVFRKTNLWPYIICQQFTYIEELLSFKHSVRRSGISWFLFTKFSKFFCGENYVKIFGGIISWPNRISYLKGYWLSLDISGVLKIPFLTDFAIWKFVSFELPYLIISAMGD